MLSYRKKVCREVLRVVFAQHTVDNAFFPLNMGPNPSGIFGATPTDLMHAFEEGVVPYLLDIIVDPLQPQDKTQLDRLANLLFTGNNRRGAARSDYPRVTFSGDFTSLSLLSADEKMGKLLLLYIIGNTPRGRSVLNKRCSIEFDETKKQKAQQFKGLKAKETAGDGNNAPTNEGHSTNEPKSNTG